MARPLVVDLRNIYRADDMSLAWPSFDHGNCVLKHLKRKRALPASQAA
jgi:hypothetical protein